MAVYCSECRGPSIGAVCLDCLTGETDRLTYGEELCKLCGDNPTQAKDGLCDECYIA